MLKLLAVWPDGVPIFFLLFLLEKSVSQLRLFPFSRGPCFYLVAITLREWRRHTGWDQTLIDSQQEFNLCFSCAHTLLLFAVSQSNICQCTLLFWFSCFKGNRWHLWTSLQCVARPWPFLIQRNACKRCKNTPAASCCPVAMVTGHTTTTLWPGVWRPEEKCVWICVSLHVCGCVGVCAS